VDGGVRFRTDVEKPLTSKQCQAAEPSDFAADFAAVLVVPVLADESADLDEEESEDELPDSLEGAGTLAESEPLRESLPDPRRESLRESVR